jgi:hypothetical protein
MKSLHLVPLAGGARADIVAYNTTIMLDEELSPQALQRLLDPLVPHRVGELEHVWQ